MRINEVLLLELNVHPDALKAIDDYLADLENTIMNKYAPGMNHKPFLKRIKNDIINGKPLWKGGKSGLPFTGEHEYGEDYWDILTQYTPTEKDPDFIKNASGEVYHLRKSTNPHAVNKDFVWQTPLKQLISRLFSPTEVAKDHMHMRGQDLEPDDVWDGDIASWVPGAGFPELIKLSKLKNAPEHVKKVLPAIIQKYEQGKYDYQSLNDAIYNFKVTVANKWKYDPKEKTRVEKEAPIIMAFDDGFMWVRLDSIEEMQREGEMMQNCIGGTYCPIDPTGGADDKDDYDEDDYDEDNESGRSQALIYSLRDKNGESHISVHYEDWYPLEKGDPLPEPAQIKGKQNDKVSKKYLPYFEKFEAFLKKNPEKFGPLLTSSQREHLADAKIKKYVSMLLTDLFRYIEEISYNPDDDYEDTGYPDGYADDIENFINTRLGLDVEERLFPNAPEELPEEGTEMRRYYDALQTILKFDELEIEPGDEKIKDIDGQDMSQVLKAAKMARDIAFPEDAGQNESVELTRLKQLAGM